jgi:hypothetical protein
MTSQLTKKTYNLITNPNLPGYSITNYGDRMFIMKYPNDRVTSYIDGITIGGDAHWDMTDENILKIADHLLEEKRKELETEKNKPKKYESYQCQKCGSNIGWLGRFLFGGLLHECKKV